MSEKIIGLVAKHTGSHYKVRLGEGGRYVECTVRGKLRLKDFKTTNPIAVGDRVLVDLNEKEDSGVILDVCERRNYIIRRSSNLSRQAHVVAANVDMAYLVVTLIYPETKIEFIDRFLVSAEAYHVPVTILVNKIDLYESELEDVIEEFEEIYTSIGYKTMRVSALRGDGIEDIKKELAGKVSVFSGNSGVGKSTLINVIDPSLDLRTGKISDYHQKGVHTTTFYEMVELASGGFIVDTPGIKGFGLVDIDKRELSHFFPELFKYGAGCKFNMCTHRDEPLCAVRKAVEDGLIAESRYASYLSIFDDDESKYR